MYFSGGVHTLSYQRSPSHPIPAQRTINRHVRSISCEEPTLVAILKVRIHGYAFERYERTLFIYVFYLFVIELFSYGNVLIQTIYRRLYTGIL